MTSHLDLIVAAHAQRPVATLHLQDAHGALLAAHEADFTTIRASLRDGLFNLRSVVQRYADDGHQAQAVSDVGVCIAQQVLGEQIMGHLWRPAHQRTLRVLLPGAVDDHLPLAAALARVPWEIARPALGQPSLAERNLLVRVVHSMEPPPSQPMQLAADEPLRLLIVLAEARGARPLGARAERLALLQMLRTEVYPQRRVQADVLCHGVTRAGLQEQIRQQGGYHLLHWSGHGHQNLLELAGDDGQAGHLSGADLLTLFVDAGGFLPRLVFLSACHSGDLVRVRDWDDFQAVSEGRAPRSGDAGDAGATLAKDAAEPLERKLDLAERPGFTGTAHALLQGGVPTVVAMRYAVGDDYAAALAVAFYRALLADANPKTAAAALTHARRALQDPGHPGARRFAACDHATPLLYGQEQPSLQLPPGPSPALNPPNPCLHHIAEFQSAAHANFVGRSWELAALGSGFIGSTHSAASLATALVTGLGGMGKTALVAELLALWQQRFQWVLLYQAKPHPLGLESWLRDVHATLVAELGLYHQHVKAKPADAIYRDAEPSFDGAARVGRLTRNLLRALHSEPVLLVLDNFETHLAAPAAPSAPAASAAPAAGEAQAADARCADPAWDTLLHALASGLVGSPSRLLLTSRRPLAALPAALACRVALGPLPAAEAALFLRQHPVLARWLFSADPAEQQQAQRLLAASRFHPLLMDRLARLAAVPGQAATLQAALAALEGTAGHAALPALFAARAGDAAELAYLDEALVRSLDRLIAELEPVARQALWLVALTNQPETGALLQAVWADGEDETLQQLRRVQALLPLLHRLAGLGLLSAAGATGSAADELGACTWGCHELVRERMLAWMAAHPADLGGRSPATLQSALAGRLQTGFEALQGKDGATALTAGRRALVYAVQAGDWDRLGEFASGLVTSLRDPQQLLALLPHLQAAADAAPEGRLRWTSLTYLADALRLAGRPDTSLAFYDSASAMARAVAEAGGDDAQQAWSDLGAISGNAASALGGVGDLAAAKQRRLASAEAKRRGGRAEVDVISSELEALRIDLMQDRVHSAVPEIEQRLGRVAGWWHAHRAGQTVPEAPDVEVLDRAYIGALNIATQADFARKDWPSALLRLEAMLDAKRALQRSDTDIASDRMNRAIVLTKLPGRLAEAKAELEACLVVFRGDPARSASTLGSLASLFDDQGDAAQAVALERRALAMREQLPDPSDRALSHGNLVGYLAQIGGPAALAEAPLHQMAALVYRLVAGLGQHLQTSLRHYVIDFRSAQSTGQAPNIPRLTDLLADPAFHPLALWLRQRQERLDDLQASIDNFLAQARQTAQSPAE